MNRRRFIGYALASLSVVGHGCHDNNGARGNSDPPVDIATNTAARWPDNIVGRFYVTDACIDCDLCKETAPANFKRNEADAHCFVVKQPATDAELKLCLEAAEGCPVEAIVDTQKPSSRLPQSR